MHATLASGRLVCISPSYMAAFVTLEVSIDGGFSFSSSGTLYEFKASSITSIRPQHGPTLGGTMVTITGYNLSPPSQGSMNTASIWCKFDSFATVLAQHESASKVLCRTPAYGRAAPVQVQLLVHGSLLPSYVTFVFIVGL